MGSPASKRWWFEAALPAGTGAVAVTPRGGLQKLKVTPLPPRRQRGLGIQRNDGSARKNNLAQVAGLNSLAISCLALVPLPRVMIFSLFDLFPAAQTDNTHPCCLIKPGSPQDCQRRVPRRSCVPRPSKRERQRLSARPPAQHRPGRLISAWLVQVTGCTFVTGRYLKPVTYLSHSKKAGSCRLLLLKTAYYNFHVILPV